MTELAWKVGRIFGIEIRLHISFFLGILLLVFWGVRGGSGLLVSVLWALFLFVFVLLHELGHCWAAVRNGARAESILLWPLGGLATISGGRNDPGATIQIAAMGPAVNLLACIIIGGGLLLSGHTPQFNPFFYYLTGIGWVDFVNGLFLMNLVLLCFNLLPGFPLDGGRILQGILQTSFGYGKSMLIATRVGQIASFGVAFFSIIFEKVILVFIAIFMFYECWRERQRLKEGAHYYESEMTFGHDFSGGYTTVEGVEARRRTSWLGRMQQRRRQKKAARAAQEDAEIRRKVDDLLEKVSREGLKSLTSKERRFLHSASRKFIKR